MTTSILEEQESKVRESTGNAWEKFHNFNSVSTYCGELGEIVESAINLAGDWVLFSEVLERDLTDKKIADVRAVGDAVVPVARAAMSLFDKIKELLLRQASQDCCLTNEQEFNHAREDMEGVHLFMNSWPTSASEQLLLVREEIARGNARSAWEIDAECGMN